MPGEMKRWDGFSVTNASQNEAKLTYVRLNRQTPCPPRGAACRAVAVLRRLIPVNQECCRRLFHSQHPDRFRSWLRPSQLCQSSVVVFMSAAKGKEELELTTTCCQIVFQHNGQTVMTTTKQYDLLNRLTGISSFGGASSASPISSFNYQYNSANQRTLVTNVDNSYWNYQYDFLGQVSSGKRYWADGTPVAGQQFEYGYDTIGNRLSTKAGGDGSGLNLRTANYTANNLNQYTSRDVPGYVDLLGSANPNATVTVNLQRAVRQGSYFWDELNMNNSSAALWLSLTNLAVLNNGNNPDIIATNIGNVFLAQTPETFGYDADGDMTNSGRWTITWDAENRATSFTSVSSVPTAAKKKVDCAYDYQGRRIQKIVSTNNGSIYVAQSTNRFVYDGWNLVGILDGGNNLLYSFQWGSDLSGSLQGAGGVGGLLSMTVYAGTNAGTYFYAYDGNGNVAALMNAANGALAAQYEYDPFLGITRASGAQAFVNPFLGSTKFFDAETGLYYYGYRYYDPSTGRWPSRDPLGELGFQILAGNRNRRDGNLYCFVRNNPLTKFDLLGLTTVTSPDWFPGARDVNDNFDFTMNVNDGQDETVVLRRVTMAEVGAEMSRLVSKLQPNRSLTRTRGMPVDTVTFPPTRIGLIS
jgi:RHS repeat-associated protein